MPQTTRDYIKQVRVIAITRGLIMGVALVAASIFSYYLITALTTSDSVIVFGPYFFAVVLPLILTVIFCISMRAKLGGYWEFKQAVTAIYIMFLACYIVLTIGRDIIFARFIEPDMIQKTEAVMIRVKGEMMKAQGAKPADIKKGIDDLRKEFDTSNTQDTGDLTTGFIINLLMLFVVAVIFGAIYKKPYPYTLQVNQE